MCVNVRLLCGCGHRQTRTVACLAVLILVSSVTTCLILPVLFGDISVDLLVGVGQRMISNIPWNLELDVCFKEVPTPPDFWGSTGACPLGSEPENGYTYKMKVSFLIQHHRAPNATRLSPQCATFVEDFDMNQAQRRRFNHRNVSQYTWGISDLPRVELRDGVRPDNHHARPGNDVQRSVLVQLIDALGRGVYNRLLAPSIRAAAANDFTVFEFTRFHVVGCCSARNTRAAYSGMVPELSESLRTGVPLPIEDDQDTCTRAYNAGTLARVCKQLLWGQFLHHGYHTMDSGFDGGNYGIYLDSCRKACANFTTQQLTVGQTKEGLHKAAAAAFHSLTTPVQPVFATGYSDAVHNGDMDVGSIAYDMVSMIHSIRQSASERGVHLPLIVFFGDHGQHYGNAMNSLVGRLEHKFPALVLLVPNSLLADDAAVRRHLFTNQHRLTSAFDLHHTLAEFARGKQSADSDLRDESSNSIIHPRNLFREEVPLDRECKDAGVEHRYCACQGWKSFESDSLSTLRLANAAITMLNERIITYLQRAPECSTHLYLNVVTFPRLSEAPPSIEFTLVVSPSMSAELSGARQVYFLVSMMCNMTTPALRGTGNSIDASQFTACNLAEVFRVSPMSKAEDDAYKRLGAEFGGHGKLCVVS
eukprot:TRINITY_DN67386_c0_g1_i1.p1 TRINITY_DN67386_c0_g1~~TRINITY_DN67386_c0_g1_i1.p1  ORF type:complete len:646 (+),score=23.03 TRINITY_DN67386_c0_g1_i1:73-2010(+)